jgi:hypothetical protein
MLFGSRWLEQPPLSGWIPSACGLCAGEGPVLRGTARMPGASDRARLLNRCPRGQGHVQGELVPGERPQDIHGHISITYPTHGPPAAYPRTFYPAQQSSHGVPPFPPPRASFELSSFEFQIRCPAHRPPPRCRAASCPSPRAPPPTVVARTRARGTRRCWRKRRGPWTSRATSPGGS